MMEKGFIYSVVIVIIFLLILISSFKRRFYITRMIMQLVGLFIIPGITVLFFNEARILIHDNSALLPISGGFAGGIFLYYFLLKRWIGFSTFEHELTHAIVALLFFRRIKRFVVTKYKGGYIQHSNGFGGEFGNRMISLAPYYLPTMMLLSVLARPFLPDIWFPWYDIWIGITFAWQLMDSIDEIKRNWSSRLFLTANTDTVSHTDIKMSGFIFSFIIIVALLLFFLGIILFIINNGYEGIGNWLKSLFSTAYNIWHALFREILTYFKSL